MVRGQIETPNELIPADGFIIEFPDVSPATAGVYATELETDLKNAKEDAEASFALNRLRTDPETQDIGTVLAIILGAKASVAIAKGIAKWFHRNNMATIKIKTRTGEEYKITNLESRDVEGIISALMPSE